MTIKAICIDDTNKPPQIPDHKWVKSGQEYTIIKVTVHPNQNDIQGCELSEISLDESCAPYEYFKISRFAIQKEDLTKLISLIMLSSELSLIDVYKILDDERIELLN